MGSSRDPGRLDEQEPKDAEMTHPEKSRGEVSGGKHIPSVFDPEQEQEPQQISHPGDAPEQEGQSVEVPDVELVMERSREDDPDEVPCTHVQEDHGWTEVSCPPSLLHLLPRQRRRGTEALQEELQKSTTLRCRILRCCFFLCFLFFFCFGRFVLC